MFLDNFSTFCDTSGEGGLLAESSFFGIGCAVGVPSFARDVSGVSSTGSLRSFSSIVASSSDPDGEWE